MVFHGAYLHAYHIKYDRALSSLVHEKVAMRKLDDVLGETLGAGLGAVRLAKAEVTGQGNRQAVGLEVQFIGLAQRLEESRVL